MIAKKKKQKKKPQVLCIWNYDDAQSQKTKTSSVTSLARPSFFSESSMCLTWALYTVAMASAIKSSSSVVNSFSRSSAKITTLLANWIEFIVIAMKHFSEERWRYSWEFLTRLNRDSNSFRNGALIKCRNM